MPGSPTGGSTISLAGQGHNPSEGAPIDTQFRISDEEGLEWVGRLLSEEGLCLGLSSGINVAGAIALGQQLVAEGREDVRDEALLGVVLEVGHRGGFGQRSEDGTCRRRRRWWWWRWLRGLLLMRILHGTTILSKGMLVHLVLRLGQSRGLLLGQGSYH